MRVNTVGNHFDEKLNPKISNISYYLACITLLRIHYFSQEYSLVLLFDNQGGIGLDF